MKNSVKLILLGISLAGVSALADNSKWDIKKYDLSKLPPASDQANVTYDKDIKPLFEASCVRCHGEHRPKGDLRLDSLKAVLDGGMDGKVVVPGASSNSILVAAAAQIDNHIAMPPKFGGGHGGPGGPGGFPPPPGGFGGPGGPGGGPGGPGGSPPGGPGGPGGWGSPPKALTAAEVGLVRAWIDQGAN